MSKVIALKEYGELIPVCHLCGSPEIGEKFSGDEGWTVCDNCGAVEQGYDYVTESELED